MDIVREDLEEDGSVFDAFVQTGKKSGLALEWDGCLKKVPKGFESSAYADYARLKNYLLGTTLTEEQVTSADLLEYLLRVFKANKPFLEYLNHIIEYTREEQ